MHFSASTRSVRGSRLVPAGSLVRAARGHAQARKAGQYVLEELRLNWQAQLRHQFAGERRALSFFLMLEVDEDVLAA
jgi:hypothetical protein